MDDICRKIKECIFVNILNQIKTLIMLYLEKTTEID